MLVKQMADWYGKAATETSIEPIEVSSYRQSRLSWAFKEQNREPFQRDLQKLMKRGFRQIEAEIDKYIIDLVVALFGCFAE